MSQKNPDSPVLDANLSKLDLGAEARAYHFAFKGERFTTIDLKDLDPDAVMEAMQALNNGDLWATARLLLPKDEFKRFKGLKPTVWELKGLDQTMQPVFEELFGSPAGFTG